MSLDGIDPTTGKPLPTEAEVAYSINKLIELDAFDENFEVKQLLKIVRELDKEDAKN